VGDPDFPDDEKDANHLYSVLENHVIPVYYNNKEKWESIMKEAIKTGVEFTADRMIKEYNQKYYQVK
jgi:starch phosphorylase